MQDSIEDYIKILNNTKQNDAKLSKEALDSIEYKKKCEKYAYQIVEFLIDGKIHQQVFLRSLNFINQEHYQDVVEERAVSNLCGYALCGKKLPVMPNKQFHISSKLNKIFDISERKYFCSNLCFYSSSHVKKQVDTSPLWLRGLGSTINIKLYIPNEPIYPGTEVELSSVKSESTNVNFTSVVSFTEVCLDEVQENELFANNNESVDNENLKSVLKKPSLETLDEDPPIDKNLKKSVNFSSEVNILEYPSTSSQIHAETHILNSTKRHLEPLKEEEIHIDEEKMKAAISKVNKNARKQTRPILLETETNPEKHCRYYNAQPEIPKYAHKIIEKIKPTAKDDNLDLVINKVKKLSIKNDDKINEVISRIKTKPVSKKGAILIDTKENPEVLVTPKVINKPAKPVKMEKTMLEKLKDTFSSWFTINTYIFLYGEEEVKKVLDKDTLSEYYDKLHVMELETTQQIKYMEICKRLQLREIAEDKFTASTLGHELKLPPDYSELKKEGSKLKLKVRAFYSGDFYETENTNFPQEKGSIYENLEEGSPAVLPLADASSQNALRKKIFSNSVSKYVQSHVEELKLHESVLPEVLSITKTFKLEANNIIFKPPVWNIIAIVLMFILSKKDEILRNALKSKEGKVYVESVFSQHKEGFVFLEEILQIVTNINEFIEKYITMPR